MFLVMSVEEKKSQSLNLTIYSQWVGILLGASVVLGGLSLTAIAIRLGPVARQANSWNECVTTTLNFLSTVEAFRSVGRDGLEAMSVSLCNGSTPQKNENSSTKPQ